MALRSITDCVDLHPMLTLSSPHRVVSACFNSDESLFALSSGRCSEIRFAGRDVDEFPEEPEVTMQWRVSRCKNTFIRARPTWFAAPAMLGSDIDLYDLEVVDDSSLDPSPQARIKDFDRPDGIDSLPGIMSVESLGNEGNLLVARGRNRVAVADIRLERAVQWFDVGEQQVHCGAKVSNVSTFAGAQNDVITSSCALGSTAVLLGTASGSVQFWDLRYGRRWKVTHASSNPVDCVFGMASCKDRCIVVDQNATVKLVDSSGCILEECHFGYRPTNECSSMGENFHEEALVAIPTRGSVSLVSLTPRSSRVSHFHLPNPDECANATTVRPASKDFVAVTQAADAVLVGRLDWTIQLLC